nr:cilia- and flagella-associated protein 206 [Leptinotarsa decemlineata]
MDAASRIRFNIVREIMRECFPRKLKPNEHFVGYFVKLLLMDPNWGITENLMNSRSNVQKFVQFVISQLEMQNTLHIITLKMQFYFNCTLEHMDTVIFNHRQETLRRLLALKEEICKATLRENPDVLRKKMAIYVTFVSGLGNPMIDMVYEEAFFAIKSIMNEEEAKEFILAPRNVKESQLELMNKIVCGIRLFNKDSDKGGAGVPNLPDLLDRAVTVVKKEAQFALLKIMETVNLLTTAIDKCYVMIETEDQNYTMVSQIPSNLFGQRLDQSKDILILYRQYELCVRKIMEELDKLEERASNLYGDLDNLLRKIHRTVHMRIAVPVSIIFPLFEELSDLWVNMQNQVILMSKLHDIMISLEVYTKNLEYNKEWLESVLDNQPAVTDAERLEKTANCSLKSTNEEVQVFRIENFQNIDKVRLQFLGFCCWKFVETDGGLIPGNPSMGIVKYKNLNYVFSTPEACESFSKNPDRRVPRVIELIEVIDHDPVDHRALNFQICQICRKPVTLKEKQIHSEYVQTPDGVDSDHEIRLQKHNGDSNLPTTDNIHANQTGLLHKHPQAFYFHIRAKGEERRQ